MRTIPKRGGLPALLVCLRERCRHLETTEQGWPDPGARLPEKALPHLRAAGGGGIGFEQSRSGATYWPFCALRACRSASLRNVITATLLVRE